MNTKFISLLHLKKILATLFTGLLLFAASTKTQAQLGVYSFTGAAVCPHPNPAINSQPANATFSNYAFVGPSLICHVRLNEFESENWTNSSQVVNTNEYIGFTVTPASGYNLTLSQLRLNQRYDRDPAGGVTKYVLRSSLDNYTSDIATDTVTLIMQTDIINLPAGSFTNVGAVTFRLYLLNCNSTLWVNWRNDEVTLYGTVNSGAPPSSSLALYPFTGTGTCPNQNPAVNTQPVNAVFSNYSSVNTSCQGATDVFQTRAWNLTPIIDLTQYNQFTITPTVGLTLTLNSIVFDEYLDQTPVGTTNWYLRSSQDGFATDIATGTATGTLQTITVPLPTASFTNIGAVTFRFYITNAESNGRRWTNDEVTIFGTVNGTLPPNPANPTSNSPQCNPPGVTLNFTGSAPAGETWYWQTTAAGTSTVNSASSYTVSSSGTYYVRSRDNTTLAWSSGAGSLSVIVTANVGTPVFTSGTTSARCQGASTITYTATANNNTGITYSLDAASITGGNSIDALTGVVTYAAGWASSSIITATATGCNGPTNATHTVTITTPVGTPAFTLGASSTRCQGTGTVTYIATASNSTSITYSLDAASITGGNAINASTGAVTYAAGWSGTSIITATASGCTGPATATHTVTITPTVGSPVFALGASSIRCQGASAVNYGATATNTTGIIYSLDGVSTFFGNTINSATGDVTYTALWFSTSTITASAAGCNGPKTATHTVTVTATIGNVTFTSGNTSTRCVGAGTVTYTANSSGNTGITYTLDATSIAAGNSINAATGAVTYTAGWLGTSTIIATATGCNGPKTGSHTATTNDNVTTPVFTLGATSIRCQGAGTVTYAATASNTTGITYSLDATTGSFPGNSINTSTGALTYAAGWSGTSTITASAAGCAGPLTAAHTITITPTVGTPVFTLGAASTRCQSAGLVSYAATSTNNTGLTFTLDAASTTGGNTINSTNGDVTYVAGWSGTSTITATATGCSGPKTATHTVTTNGLVGIPVFALGSASIRCQSTNNVTYNVSAANNTGISWSIDAASIAGGNVITSSTGLLNYISTWSGTTIITATATGCSGPTTATHTVTITPTVGTPVFTLGAASTICQGAGTVSYDASSTNNTGITYSLNAAAITGGNSINAATGLVTYAAGWTGSTIITASATGCNGPKTATHTVTITPTVGNPSFTFGATSIRCQGGNTVTYTASATNSTLSYALDAASITGGNTINAATGVVVYAATWNGTSVITVTATGCNGPKTANHTVTIIPTVGNPIFALGASSTRCQGGGLVAYSSTATNATSITYSLDGASTTAGNSINSTNGTVAYIAGYTGTSVITASAAGCNGPKTSTHTVTITPTVGTPVFTGGTTSVRCQGAGSVTYPATATNTTGITYSLDASSISGGNAINSATGAVTYAAAWSGTSTITASAAGCNGPKTATHTVTITASVGTPVFAMGAQSTRTQVSGTVTYTATATQSTGISYVLDAASLAGGNTINAATGAVTWTAGWNGTSMITASATGCNGPSTSGHIVTINPAIVQAPLYLSAPGQILDRIDPVATGLTTTFSTVDITASGTVLAIDATNSFSAANPAVTSFTVSHTTGSGSNRLMLVGVSQKNKNITSLTYGGIALTLVGENVSSTNARMHIYKLINPPSGTANVVVNLDAAPDRGIVIGVTTFTGVDQVTPLGTFSSAVGNSVAATTTVNAANGEMVFDVATYRVTTMGANAGQTERYNINSGNEITGGASTTAGASSVSMSWNGAASQNWAIGAVSVKPASGINTLTFTQVPALCADLIIKAQTISVLTYVSITSGTMPANPSITAQIKYGSTNIITLSNPVYNSASQVLTWTGVLGADSTVPSGQAIALQITSAQPGVVFKILYRSASKPSRISLFPVSTFIDITSFNVYTAAYPGGSIRTSGNPGTTMYARAVVTTPFGYTDITKLTINFNPPGSTVNVACVDSTSCTRTYEYPWTIPAGYGNIAIMATAYEGYENIIKNSEVINFATCLVCAPVAQNDSAVGAGGAPITIDVLANDYDPNNNIKPSTLAVLVQGNNGSGYLSNNKIVYVPNGSFAGRDTLTYEICDSTALCGSAQVYLTINPFLVDPCSEATKSHTYYIPFSENEARMALDSSTNNAIPTNNIRTIISLKMPYPGMVIVWDEWEDGYEINPLNATQTTTKVWGDGNPYNGIVPGYTNDIIPAGGSIVLDNTIPTNPRVQANIFYDGRDKIFASGQITVTQVSGEPSLMSVQCMKTNVARTLDYGTTFTIPVGQDFNSQDFRYTALFIRAAQNNTVINIDKDNNGTLETTATINEGDVFLVNGGVMSGATITSSGLIGVDLHFGGNDGYSSRDVPIFPATWYSNTYYSPVPTTGRAQNPADTAVVMLYNSLNRALTINYTSGIPSSGTITIPAKSTVRFPLGMSQTAGYKFINLTGESFTAIQICDSYTPGGGGNIGTEYDWSFNLIAENRLTDFATIAWAPGSIDGTRNDNPIWVTPTANTTIYVKYNGNVSGTTGLISPCGLRYDVSYPLNALNHKRLLDASDNDQSGLAVFTCDGTKLAAVYGEDPSTAVIANPSWDVGSTIQPFCKQKLIFANDDYSRTMVNQPVTIPVLLNDFGFLAIIDPASVTNTGLLLAKNGTIFINTNGTIIYTPNPGFVGKDTFEYSVCSTPSPIVCDNARVYVDIAVCPAPFNQNIIAGKVFLDKNDDGLNNDGGTGFAGAKVYLYVDGNCNTAINANELKDSVIVDASGTYQFITYPEKFVADDFDSTGNINTCAYGSDGNAAWLGNWTDIGDPSVGFCNNSQTAANTDVEIKMDNAFGYALRLKDANRSATRTVNLSGASYAFLTFSYRRKSATLTAGKNVTVQASKDGVAFGTVFTIAGDGTTDANYVTIYNQDITQYAAATTYLRFLTNAAMGDADTVYIDNIKIQFLRYPQCYITRLDPASVPAFHHTTTLLQHNFTAVSTQTCLSPYDYGIAKNKITVSGNMFNDANGLMDGIVNGTGMGVVNSMVLYAYLIDTSGKVVYRTTVAVGGAFSFPAVDILTNFTLRLSTTSLNIGDNAPSDVALPADWIATGDCFGINNNAGTGNSVLAPCAKIAVNTGTVNITGVNFGIERLPDSDDKSRNYTVNVPGMQYAVPGFSGSDPEDGVLGSGKTYKITTVPNNAVLFYNGALVTANMVITSFDPTLLLIDPSDNALVCTFTYASRDAAGYYDPTPAAVTITWSQTLPVKLISFSGRLNGSKVDLNWVTANELNTKHFEVERSADGLRFSKLATVTAKGNSNSPTSYDLVDPAPLKGVNYYRLKMVDIDGKFEYSQVVIIRIENSIQLVTKVAPNPFTGKIDVYLTLTHNTPVDFRFIDINGRMVFSKSVKGLKGFNWFTINDLDKLPSAPYMLHIKTDDATIVEKLIKQ